MAVGMLGVLAIAGATATYYASTNTRSASQSKASNLAFSLAEAGLNNSLAILSNPGNDPMDPNLLSPRTETYEDGTVTYSGTLDVPNAKWTITSTGAKTNPTGSGAENVRRKLSAKVPVYPLSEQALAAVSWNYVYSWGTGDASGCDMTLNSSVIVETRLIVAGELCLASSSSMSGAESELLVGGRVNLNGSGGIGASGSGNGILRADVAGGCKVSTGSLHVPCQGPQGDTAPGHLDRVWAATITTSPAIQAAPNPDWDGWYKMASPGPYKPCEAPTGTPPVFDNDQGSTPDVTKRNRSVPGTFNLTPTSSYTCRTTLAGQPLGELSWNNTSKVLTIKGVIFIDGNAKLTQPGSYTGQATLYLSGSFWFEGGPEFCAVLNAGSCDNSAGAWNPNDRLFTIVTNGGAGQDGVLDGYSIVLSGTGDWQGALYGGPYKISVENSFKFAGPLIADEVVLNGSVQSKPFTTITEVVPGMPGNATVYAQPDKPQLFSG